MGNKRTGEGNDTLVQPSQRLLQLAAFFIVKYKSGCWNIRLIKSFIKHVGKAKNVPQLVEQLLPVPDVHGSNHNSHMNFQPIIF